MSEDLSNNGEKIKALCEYKLIEDALHGGIIPSYNFLLEHTREEHFPELYKIYVELMSSIHQWLMKVYSFFPKFEELTVEEKGHLAVALSTNLLTEEQNQ